MIYLDYAATSPLEKEVLDTFNAINNRFFANTSSSHKLGFEVALLESKARKQIASLFSCKENEVIFTSGATESNNMAIKGIALKYANRGKHIITSLGEHSSVLNCFKQLETEFGFRVTYLPLQDNGEIYYNDLEKSMTDETILVSLMSVNNEVGSIHNIKLISDIVKKYNKAFLHVDATQSIGKIDIDFSNVDLISLSAHKINGFKGSGLLIKKSRADLFPLFNGGGQEFSYRPGTNNFAYEVCLAKVLRIAFENQKSRYDYVKKLNDLLRKELSSIPEIKFNSPDNASPYILNFYVNKKASVVSEALSNKDIYVSTQSACSSKKTKYSHVLQAMGRSIVESENSIRVSLSYLYKEEDIINFVNELKNILKNIK